MAIYYNLCVDCGENGKFAEHIARHFDGLVIKPPGLDSIRCKTYRELQRGLEFVGVQPAGMGHGTLPESERRTDLTDDATIAFVRQALYEELRRTPGFRRAVFGEECWDTLVNPVDDEMDREIDYTHMIYATDFFPHSPANPVTHAFAPGYQMVMKSAMAS